MTRPRRTIISHFYNEEYLLPWWVAQHASLFDHGIMINYGSTDRSVQVIRHHAPHWEIRDSRNTHFDAHEVDAEVMEIEREVDGWKIVLNTTEFLVCKDMDKFLQQLDELGHHAYCLQSAHMIDPLHLELPDPIYRFPLYQQRYYGLIVNHGRNRVIHRYPDGDYIIGRHGSNHPGSSLPPGAMILWYGFSPWNEQLKKRKLQIKNKMGAFKGYGGQHLMNEEEIEALYQEFAQAPHYTDDLRENEEFRRLCF